MCLYHLNVLIYDNVRIPPLAPPRLPYPYPYPLPIYPSYTDGTVLVTHGGTEMGQGLHTKICQVAATAFGIPVTDVHVAETATDKVPNSSPTAASMSSDLYGMAVLDACTQIKRRLVPYEQAPGEGKEGKEGKTDASEEAADLDASAAFKAAVVAAFFDRVNLSAQGYFAVPNIGYDWNMETGDNTDRFNGSQGPFNYYTYGTALSEVEIDTLTGDFRVMRADVMMDVGNTLNPALDIGQIEGAFVQGLGWCTMEELVWGDREHSWIRPGNLFTAGPGTYKIPSFNDVPVDMRITLLKDATNPRAIHSSKAVGEPPLFLAASAFFAVREAIQAARDDAGLEGWFDLACPATSERVRMACQDQFTGRFVDAGDREWRARQSL